VTSLKQTVNGQSGFLYYNGAKYGWYDPLTYKPSPGEDSPRRGESMIFKKQWAREYFVLLFCLAMSAGNAFAFSDIAFITVDELKARLDRNDSILIIDVRTTDDFIGADNKIATAIHIRSKKTAGKARRGTPEGHSSRQRRRGLLRVRE